MQDPAEYEMPFGTHQGMTLGEIHQEYPTYLEWARTNLDNKVVVDVIEDFLEDL